MMRPTLLLLMLTGTADAHGLCVEATCAGGVIVVTGFYDDDTPAVGAKVVVRREGDDTYLVAEGVTDTKGEWTTPVIGGGHYVVHIRTSDGHAAFRKVVIGKGNEVLTYGLSRGELTATSWQSIAFGLWIIGLLGFVSWRVVRRRSAAKIPTSSE